MTAVLEDSSNRIVHNILKIQTRFRYHPWQDGQPVHSRLFDFEGYSFSLCSTSLITTAIMELNAQLFDELETNPNTAIAQFASAEKIKFHSQIEQVRQSETASDKMMDERFE